MTAYSSLSLALALTLCTANASKSTLRAPPVVFDVKHRQLSYEFIAGYRPESQVTDHNAIDLDQAALETELGRGTDSGFAAAKRIYEEGGNSKSYATLTFTGAKPSSLTDKQEWTGEDAAGNDVIGKVYKASSTTDNQIKLQYKTTDVQDTWVGCRVGGLVDTYTAGCFNTTGTIEKDGTSYEYTYDVDTDNKNGRTIQGFSTAVDQKMINGCPGCPYDDAQYFVDYYGDYAYGDKWVQAAFAGGKTEFSSGRGNADFSSYTSVGKTEVIKKGTAYMIIFMYVIREFEDALDDCTKNCIGCNDDPVHAWDEGVAFYSGSKEGGLGAGSGKLLHQLADKRCTNFGTCLDDGVSSKVNKELFDLFNVGQGQLLTGKCEEARETTAKITKLMYIPLIQGTLRYAYKMEFLQGGEKEGAEGAVFAAAVLPRVYAADEDAADTIYSSMKVGASSTSFKDVKKAFEGVYKDIGVSCDDIGGLLDPEGNYYDGAAPCKSGGSKKSSVIGAVLGSIAAVAAIVAVGFIFFMRKRERAGKPVFKGPESGPGADGFQDA